MILQYMTRLLLQMQVKERLVFMFHRKKNKEIKIKIIYIIVTEYSYFINWYIIYIYIMFVTGVTVTNRSNLGFRNFDVYREWGSDRWENRSTPEPRPFPL